jgi:hypothetical protein
VRFADIVLHLSSASMALSVESLNGDTSFLLTFDPPAAPLSSPGLFPGSFTILVDRKSLRIASSIVHEMTVCKHVLIYFLDSLAVRAVNHPKLHLLAF